MRVRSRTSALMMIILLALATACSPPGGAEQQGAETLRINVGQSPYTDAVVEEFKAQHPDLKVEVTGTTLSFEDGSVQSHLRSGRGADVLLVNSGPGRVGQLADGGLIADLSDLYDEENLKQRYPENVVDQISRDSGIHEIVEGRDIFQVHAHSKIFEQAGLELPKTWDQLLATCKPLAAQGKQPMVVGARDNFAGGWLLGTLVQSTAGENTMKNVLFADGSFEQEAIVRGGQRLADLVSSGCINGKNGLALEFEQAVASFGQGEAAMTVGTQATVPDLTADGVDTSDVAVFPMPADDPKNAIPTSGLAVSWIVNAETQSMPAAREWMAWVASDEYQKVAVENGMGLAPARSISDSVQLNPVVAQAANAVADRSGYNPSVYLPAAAKEEWYAAVQGLLSGNGDAEALMGMVEAAAAEARENS